MPATTRHARVTTALGEITLVARGDALVGVYFPGHWYQPNSASFGSCVAAAGDPLLNQSERQITEFLAGEREEFDLPTATTGDAFQEQVWALITKIPFGETATYGDLAHALGGRHLARDVGQAVGRNPLSIVVPCHRVVGKDGKLTGYAGGLTRKRSLLQLEGHQVSDQGGQAAIIPAVQQAMPLLVASGS